MPNKTDQDRYYERMHAELDKNEATGQFVWSCVKGFFILIGSLIGIIILLSIIGSVWVMIFGPSN